MARAARGGGTGLLLALALASGEVAAEGPGQGGNAPAGPSAVIPGPADGSGLGAERNPGDQLNKTAPELEQLEALRKQVAIAEANQERLLWELRVAGAAGLGVSGVMGALVLLLIARTGRQGKALSALRADTNQSKGDTERIEKVQEDLDLLQSQLHQLLADVNGDNRNGPLVTRVRNSEVTINKLGGDIEDLAWRLGTLDGLRASGQDLARRIAMLEGVIQKLSQKPTTTGPAPRLPDPPPTSLSPSMVSAPPAHAPVSGRQGEAESVRRLREDQERRARGEQIYGPNPTIIRDGADSPQASLAPSAGQWASGSTFASPRPVPGHPDSHAAWDEENIAAANREREQLRRAEQEARTAARREAERQQEEEREKERAYVARRQAEEEARHEREYLERQARLQENALREAEEREAAARDDEHAARERARLDRERRDAEIRAEQDRQLGDEEKLVLQVRDVRNAKDGAEIAFRLGPGWEVSAAEHVGGDDDSRWRRVGEAIGPPQAFLVAGRTRARWWVLPNHPRVSRYRPLFEIRAGGMGVGPTSVIRRIDQLPWGMVDESGLFLIQGKGVLEVDGG